jgi:hypothetical protein
VITLTTLRDFSDKHDLHCCCHDCGRFILMSWMALAQKYGWEFPVNQIESKLVCKECGSKDVGIRLVFNEISDFSYGAHTP